MNSWVLTHFDTIASALSDHKTFVATDDNSAFYQRCPLEIETLFKRALLSMNPPEHTAMRKIFSDRFMPGDTRKLSHSIEELCDNLLDKIDPTEPFDFIDSFAYALPVQVIGHMMGLPLADSELLKDCTAAITKGIEPNLTETEKTEIDAKLVRMEEYFIQAIEDRKTHPKDDLLGRWTAAHLRNELDQDTLVYGAMLMFFAGHETTVNLLSNTIYSLIQNPDQLALLRSNLKLIPKCLEETLRYDTPAQILRRMLSKDLEIEGKLLEKGSTINFFHGAGNRDPRKFENPDQFLIQRFPNQHLGFGGGIHICLGMHLARLEAKTALQKFFEKFDKIELAGEPERRKTIFIRGFDHLWLRAEPK